jgi:hypothetical protein
MEYIKKSDGNLPWKLVWDAETKDVLFLQKIDGDFETLNEIYESKNKTGVLKKIEELNLKYNPNVLEEEEWV